MMEGLSHIPPETRALIGELAEKLLDAGHAVLRLLDELDGDSDLEAVDEDGTEDEDSIAPPVASIMPRLSAVTITRADRGFAVNWARDGRPTRREFGDLGSALHVAHQAAAMGNLAVVDLTGDPE